MSGYITNYSHVEREATLLDITFDVIRRKSQYMSEGYL
jgi:hypothetical protein